MDISQCQDIPVQGLLASRDSTSYEKGWGHIRAARTEARYPPAAWQGAPPGGSCACRCPESHFRPGNRNIRGWHPPTPFPSRKGCSGLLGLHWHSRHVPTQRAQAPSCSLSPSLRGVSTGCLLCAAKRARNVSGAPAATWRLQEGTDNG